MHSVQSFSQLIGKTSHDILRETEKHSCRETYQAMIEHVVCQSLLE